jgi:3-oxoacyl-[acyl-carrier protein] reductase
MNSTSLFVDQGVLVLNGTEGIAPAVVLGAAQHGATVLFSARPGYEAAAEEILASARQAGLPDRISFVTADLSSEEAVEGLFDTASERLSSLDAVIHNLEPNAVLEHKSLVDITLDEWNGVLANELRVPFLVARRAIEEFLFARVNGRIVYITYAGSEQVIEPATYATAQSGLHALVRCTTKEFGRREIASNAVVVHGAAQTALAASNGHRQTGPEKAALRTPDELVETVLFFASKESAFVNGECIDISSAWRDSLFSELMGNKEHAKG